MGKVGAGTKLTDPQLRGFLERPPASRVELKDGTVDGLAVRIGPRGRPKWTFRFRLPGQGGVTARGTQLKGARYHRIALGTYPDVSIKEARRKAAAWLEDVEAGRNPLDEIEAAAVAKDDSIADLLTDFFVHSKATRRRWKHGEWTLNRHLLPAWRERLVGSITERDAKALLTKVGKGELDPETGIAKPKPGTEMEVRKWGSALFRYAVDEGRSKANPFANTKPPKLSQRRRFLEMDEARAVWKAAGELITPWCDAVRLLLLTGCREMEICGARRAWFDPNAATLLIPPESYKSGRHFLVCLPSDAVAIFDGLERWNGGDFMLSTTNGEKSVAGVPRKIVDQLHNKAENVLGRPMARFSLHDLRRTVRTHLARLGVDDIVAEMVLGHSLRGLRATYNIYSFETEKRRALASWANELVSAKPAAEPADAKSELIARLSSGEALTAEDREALAALLAQ